MSDNQHPTNNDINPGPNYGEGDLTIIIEELPLINGEAIIEEMEENKPSDPEILKYAESHPLFLQKEDEMVGQLINLFTPLLSNSKIDKVALEKEVEGFKEILFNLVFGKKEEGGRIKKRIQEVGTE